MKNISIIFSAILITSSSLFGQTKKVLFEEFTGTACANCPEGHYRMDNLMVTYPNLIGVGLHTYNSNDAMFFPQVDTIGQEYAPGAPMAATDRIYSGAQVAQTWYAWENNIQTRLAENPMVSVSLNSTWNNTTRVINTNITCDILQNLPSGDYRFNLYVVEDSVTGSGINYDQSSFYDADPSLPFFGLGNPIVGYVHKHVTRAILPQAWGQGGIISASPLTGQTYQTTLNYTLPLSYNENKIKLVGFISKYTSNHQGDEVLNAEEITLPITVGVSSNIQKNYFSVFPNPSNGLITIKSSNSNSSYTIFSSVGEIVFMDFLNEMNNTIDLSTLKNGVYFIRLKQENNSSIQKIVISKNTP
tara:strand:+ start:80 stop:1156 length:1077 start_codon:yes stop_codon:yes gene_type:complete